MTEVSPFKPPHFVSGEPEWLLELAELAPESFWPARLMINYRVRYSIWPKRRDMLTRLRNYGYTATIEFDAALEQMHELYLESDGEHGHEVFMWEKANERGPVTRHYGLDPWYAFAVPNKRPGYPLRAYYGPNTKAPISGAVRRRWIALGLSKDGWINHFLSAPEINSYRAGDLYVGTPEMKWMV